MRIKLHWNQYTNGGSVNREGFEVENGDNISLTYGSCYSLKSIEIELPECYDIATDYSGKKIIVDKDGYEVKIIGKYNDNYIKLLDSNHQIPLHVKIIGE